MIRKPMLESWGMGFDRCGHVPDRKYQMKNAVELQYGNMRTVGSSVFGA